MKQYQVGIIDGQGGGLGKALVMRLKQEKLPIRIVALGTNSAATAQMLKGGADIGATGENAICTQAGKMDFILGAVAILAANSLMGELSPAMACAVGSSEAVKILLPLNRCSILVTCTQEVMLKDHLDHAGELLKMKIKECGD